MAAGRRTRHPAAAASAAGRSAPIAALAAGGRRRCGGHVRRDVGPDARPGPGRRVPAAEGTLRRGSPAHDGVTPVRPLRRHPHVPSEPGGHRE